jgi:hypothetical protein
MTHFMVAATGSLSVCLHVKSMLCVATKINITIPTITARLNATTAAKVVFIFFFEFLFSYKSKN